MGDEKEMLRESWEEHKAREKEAIVEKAVDKDRAKADDSYTILSHLTCRLY